MWDVIIIGAGPAGLTAGIYTSRRGLKTLIIAKNIGGQVITTSKVCNYPGIIDVPGRELIENMEKQVRDLGVDIIINEVKEVKGKGKNFIVKTPKKSYETKTVIIGCGKTPRSLNVPGEDEFINKGVCYCVTCDAPLFKGKVTSVVGGGNSALDAALLLSRIAKKVYLIHRREKFRAFEDVVKKVKSTKNIELVLNSIVKNFKGDKFLKSVIIENINTKKRRELKIDGVFVEIGSEVKTDMVKNIVKRNRQSYIYVNTHCETFYPHSNKIRSGVFAIGDVTTIPFKQIIVAAGDGAKAALEAYNYIHGIKSAIVADWAKQVKKR